MNLEFAALALILVFPALGVLFNLFLGPRLGRGAVNLVGPGVMFLSFAVASGDANLAIPRAPDDPAVDELFEIHEALGAGPVREGFGEEMVAAKRMAVRLTVTRLYGQIIDRQPREHRTQSR